MNVTESRDRPIVVIGAGAVGAATAYHLARRGRRVLVLEQFELGHDRGSSHGAARIIRHSYEDPLCARLMADAYRVWREIEADVGRPLFVRTGGVSIAPPAAGYVARVAENLAANGIPHRRMSGDELTTRLPQFGSPPEYDVVFEPDAGMLAAERAVALMLEAAVALGVGRVEIRDRTPVRRVDLEGSCPTVLLDDEAIEADRLIVAAGAWTGRLLPGLSVPLRPTRQQVLYLRPEWSQAFQIGLFPIFIVVESMRPDAFYGMPPFLGRGLKVARHGGPDVDPDIHDPLLDAEYVELIRDFLRRHIPAAARAPLEAHELCLYTEAPDDRFVVGPLGERGDVLAASPCSGHGFKFSALVGSILADLTTEGRTQYDVAPWRPTSAG